MRAGRNLEFEVEAEGFFFFFFFFFLIHYSRAGLTYGEAPLRPRARPKAEGFSTGCKYNTIQYKSR